MGRFRHIWKRRGGGLSYTVFKIMKCNVSKDLNLTRWIKSPISHMTVNDIKFPSEHLLNTQLLNTNWHAKWRLNGFMYKRFYKLKRGSEWGYHDNTEHFSFWLCNMEQFNFRHFITKARFRRRTFHEPNLISEKKRPDYCRRCPKNLPNT